MLLKPHRKDIKISLNQSIGPMRSVLSALNGNSSPRQRTFPVQRSEMFNSTCSEPNLGSYIDSCSSVGHGSPFSLETCQSANLSIFRKCCESFEQDLGEGGVRVKLSKGCIFYTLAWFNFILPQWDRLTRFYTLLLFCHPLSDLEKKWL